MNKSIIFFLGLTLLASCNLSNKGKKGIQLLEVVSNKSQVILEKEGVKFRDLNKNEKLDIYEDTNQPIEARIENLLSQMNLEEKAGMMFINGAPISKDSKPDGKEGVEGISAGMPSIVESMNTHKMTHFNIWDIPADPNIFARWYNNVQQVAEKTRLGIPILIASDPRHHFSNNIFSMSATGFSQFCETLGLAALGDEELVKEFAHIVRQEYLAVGIRESLHPQIDLATEPRWPRINGAFGEDAQLTAKMVTAYIEGMQGESLNESSIACMTKHFPGGGLKKKG